MPDYEAIYRKMHPRQFPHSPYGRQRQLSDLWEADQEEFKRNVDAVIELRASINAGSSSGVDELAAIKRQL